MRAGTNGLTCIVNRDGNQQGEHDLKPTCWDAEGSRTLLPVMLRVGVSNADIGLDPRKARDSHAPWVYAGYSGGIRTAYLMVMAAKEGGGPAH